MTGLSIPHDVLAMAAQAAVILAIALLVPNRLLLGVVAVAVAAVGLALGHPSDFSRTPGALLLDFSGVFGGLVLGGLAIGARLRRERLATARRAAARHGTVVPSRGRGIGAATAGVAVLVLLAVGAAAWQFFGDGVPPAWRRAAEQWVGAAETRAPGPRAPAGAAQPANLPAGAKAASPKAVGAPAAGTSPAAASRASAGPGHATAAGAGQAAAGDAAGRAGEHARAGRPQGDLRHCLQSGASNQDVLRCAEGR